MKTLDKPLHALTAEDLMTCNVMVVPARMSLRGAAGLLMQARVSGAPVVDDQGRCVGVLSTTDFLKAAGSHPVHRSPESCVCSEWQVVDFCAVPEDSVERYMTGDPVTVTPDIPLAELARRMLDAHIHRVIVVNEARKPIGIISSTDILAAVAYHCNPEEATL